MSKLYFHLRDGVDIILDEEGRSLDDIDSIRAAALADARSIIAEDAYSGRIRLDLRIDVEDGSGNIVHCLDFCDAIEIVYPAAGAMPG